MTNTFHDNLTNSTQHTDEKPLVVEAQRELSFLSAKVADLTNSADGIVQYITLRTDSGQVFKHKKDCCKLVTIHCLTTNDTDPAYAP